MSRVSIELSENQRDELERVAAMVGAVNRRGIAAGKHSWRALVYAIADRRVAVRAEGSSGGGDVGRIRRRASLAARLEKRSNSLIHAIDKTPSYKGKAGIIDRALEIHTLAHNLAWDLDYDAEDERQ